MPWESSTRADTQVMGLLSGYRPVSSTQCKLANVIVVRDSLLIVRGLQHHVVDLTTDADADVIDLTTDADTNVVDLTNGANADIVGTSDSCVDLTTDSNINLTDSSNLVSPFSLRTSYSLIYELSTDTILGKSGVGCWPSLLYTFKFVYVDY
jgi:hypothetical protein